MEITFVEIVAAIIFLASTGIIGYSLYLVGTKQSAPTNEGINWLLRVFVVWSIAGYYLFQY